MRKFAVAGAAIFALWAMASNGAWADPAPSSVFQSGGQVFSYSEIEALKKMNRNDGQRSGPGFFLF
jgi:hypothetical protein